jgi:hypothetical protein
VRSLEAKIEKLLLERSLNNDNGQIEHHEVCSYYVESIVDFAFTADALLSQNDMGSSKTAGHIATISISPFANPPELNDSSHQRLEASPQSRKEEDDWVSQISVDIHGGVSFHNPTSAIHEAPSPQDNVNSRGRESVPVTNDDVNEKQARTRLSLVSNAATQRRLETLAVQNMTASQTELSSTLVTEFLNFHWCWIYPMFMFVYRPAFTSKFTSML